MTYLPRHPAQAPGTTPQSVGHTPKNLICVVERVLRARVVVDVERHVLQLGCLCAEGAEEGVVLPCVLVRISHRQAWEGGKAVIMWDWSPRDEMGAERVS